jgi:excinuclease UvrABC helicase subunit UvrB
VGDKIGQRDVIGQLIRMQYNRNEQDFSRGTFRVRGDTIDIFPAEHSELAIRSSCSTTRSSRCSCSTRSPAASGRRCRASRSTRPATT